MSRYAAEDTSESLPNREGGVGPTSAEITSAWLPPSPSAVRSPHAEVVRRKATSSKDMDKEWGDDPAHIADECAEGEGAITADECAESPRTLTNARTGKAQCAGGLFRLLRGGGNAAREPGASANAPSARSSGDLFRFRRARGERRSMSWEKAPADIRGDDESARNAPEKRGAAESTREEARRGGGRTSPAGNAAGSGETRGSRAIRVPESPSNAERGFLSTDGASAAAGGHVDDDVSNFAGFSSSFESGIGRGAEASVSTSPKPLPAPKDKPPPSDTASLASAFPRSPASSTSSAARPRSASTTSSAAFPASSASPHSPAPAGRRMARSASVNERSPDMSGYSGHILPPRRSLTAQRTSANGDDISPWSAASPQFDASPSAATRSPRNAAHRAGNLNVSVNIDGSGNVDGCANTSNADDNRRNGNVNNEGDDNDNDEGAVMARPVQQKGAKRGGSADLAPSAEAQLVAAAANMLRGLGSRAQPTGGSGGAENRSLHRVASPTGSAAAGRVFPHERQGSLQRGCLQRSGARSGSSNSSSANSSFKERSSSKNGGGGEGGPGGASAIRRFSLEVRERLKQLQVSFDDSAPGTHSDHASPFDEGAYNESACTEGTDGEWGRLNPTGQVEAAAAHAASMNAHVLENAPMLSPPPSPSAASHKPSPQSHSSFSPHASPHSPASSFPIHARIPSPSSSPSSQHKPIPAIFSRPSPITTPPLHPPAPFALLASSPTHSPTCASPFPSAPSPTCPPVSPSKPPRSPTSSPGLSPSSSHHFHRASSIRLPIPLPPSSFQDPLPSPNLPHSVASCPDCTHRYPSFGLSHISPSSLPRHESPSSISGMGMGTGMGGGMGAGTGMGTGVGSGIEMGMVTGMVRGQNQRHQRSVSELTPNSNPTDLCPPSHHLTPPNLPNTATPGANAITNRRNNPQARGTLHTPSPPFSPFHPLIASPEESVAGTGTNQTLRAFTRSQSADCVEGSTALEETGVRVQAGNERRFVRRNSVDGGSFGGPLGARMGYAALASHGRGARSPIKSCISPANGSGGAKLRKQVSFNKVVQVRRFTSCDASPEYY